MNLSNVHDTNFATALQLGRADGHALPRDDDIHVFAVEIADNLTFSETLTPELEAAASPSSSTRSARKWRASWSDDR